MAQKVIKVGSSAAVTIPKHIMKKLGLKIGDPVQADLDQKMGVLEFRKDQTLNERERQVAELTLSVIDRYRKDLEALAQK